MTEEIKAIEQLQKNIEELNNKVEKLNIIHTVQNLMGKYMSYHTPENEWKALELYADRPDKSHESFAGYFVGKDLDGYLLSHRDSDEIEKEGSMFEHDLCTPVIEVADDLQTARGLWWSPGWESFAGQGKDGAPLPVWAWSKYAVDFIKQDGKWYIWHTHFYLTFMLKQETTLADNPVNGMPGGQNVDGHDLGGSNVYLHDKVYKFAPKFPEPYATFTDEMMRP